MNPEGLFYHLNGGVNPSSRTDKYNVDKNTISISEGGNSCGYVNWNPEPFFSGGHNYTLQGIVEEVSPYFLYEALKSKQSRIMGLRVGSGLPNIQKKDIEKFPLYIPSKKEQKHIEEFLKLIDSKVKEQSLLIDNLKKYKRGLLSEILSQKLLVTHETEKWVEVSLGDVADGFEYGMNAAAKAFDGVHKYIRITDIDDESHAYIESDPVSPSGALEEKYRVRKNDILFARTGASVGKSYLYQETDGNLSFAGFLIRVHVKDGVDSGYVFLNTLTEDYNRWVLLESARSGQPGINAEQYKHYRFKLPSFKTQRYIVEIAKNLDAKIHKESQKLLFLQKKKIGLLQQLFI